MTSKNKIFSPHQFDKILQAGCARGFHTINFDPKNHILHFYGKPLIELSDGFALWWGGECDFCGTDNISKKKCLNCGAPLDRMGKYLSSDANLKNLGFMI